MMNTRPRIVIAGAGFGGLYALLSLSRKLRRNEAEILLIDKNEYFLFTPLLHEVATGTFGREEVAEPLLPFARRADAKFLQGEITGIDTKSQEVILDGKRVPYDILICAFGAKTNHWSVSGAVKYALPLKNLSDALRLHEHLLDIFQKASVEKDIAKRRALLRLVVVGGGPTGVEFAGELCDFVRDALRAYPQLRAEEMDFVFIHAMKELLPGFHPRLRKWAFESLRERGWNVMLETSVARVGKENVELLNGEIIETHTVFWVAGVKPAKPTGLSFQTLRNGRIIVNRFLQVEGHPNIFALGDNAGFIGTEEGWPMLAQAAVQGAETVAKNIVCFIRQKPLRPFVYHSKGSLISLGRWKAIGEIQGMTIRGWWVWILWQMVYLTKFVSWRKRAYMLGHWVTHIAKSRKVK